MSLTITDLPAQTYLFIEAASHTPWVWYFWNNQVSQAEDLVEAEELFLGTTIRWTSATIPYLSKQTPRLYYDEDSGIAEWNCDS
jgi:hypothetical protein